MDRWKFLLVSCIMLWVWIYSLLILTPEFCTEIFKGKWCWQILRSLMIIKMKFIFSYFPPWYEAYTASQKWILRCQVGPDSGVCQICSSVKSLAKVPSNAESFPYSDQPKSYISHKWDQRNLAQGLWHHITFPPLCGATAVCVHCQSWSFTNPFSYFHKRTPLWLFIISVLHLSLHFHSNLSKTLNLNGHWAQWLRHYVWLWCPNQSAWVESQLLYCQYNCLRLCTHRGSR